MPIEDIEARAERLGITPERVLQEYARIAFADLSRMVLFDGEGMKFRAGAPTAGEMSAVVEIVASADKGRPYRIKLHDKKPVLDMIARYLGMFPPDAASEDEEEPTEEEAQSARERLILALERVAHDGAEDTGGSEPQP